MGNPVSAAVETPFPYRHELAEMPHWDAARRRLCYVDINNGTINELDVTTGDRNVIELAVPLGFAMPVPRAVFGCAAKATTSWLSTLLATSSVGCRSSPAATATA